MIVNLDDLMDKIHEIVSDTSNGDYSPMRATNMIIKAIEEELTEVQKLDETY